MEFSEPECDALGVWQGKVAAVGVCAEARSRKPLSAHYAEMAFEHAAALKLRVLVAVSEEVRMYLATVPGGGLPRQPALDFVADRLDYLEHGEGPRIFP